MVEFNDYWSVQFVGQPGNGWGVTMVPDGTLTDEAAIDIAQALLPIATDQIGEQATIWSISHSYPAGHNVTLPE